MTQRKASGGRQKLLFVLPTLNRAGAQQVVVELVRGLDPSRYAPAVCCLLGMGDFEDELRERGVDLHLLRPAGFKDVRWPVRLSATIRRIGADLVSSHFYPFDLWAVAGARLAGVPIVVTRHTTYLEPVLPRPLEWASVKLATATVAVSRSVSDFMIRERGIAADQVRVITNGVDGGRFAADPSEREAVRAQLGYAPKHLVVGTVANLHRGTKGYGVLLDAIPEVVRAHPNARFLWIGRDVDGYAETLTAKARELGVAEHLRLAGRRDDVARLLSAMDLFVLPSTFEGLGIVLIEAMISGLAVVASDVGGIPEVVADGETGLLATAGDSGAFARAICALLGSRERAREMGRAGRERARDRFDVAAMVAAYDALFTSIGRAV
ncbi:MAG: glycosyltransferase [Myxococcota bacterium]